MCAFGEQLIRQWSWKCKSCYHHTVLIKPGSEAFAKCSHETKIWILLRKCGKHLFIIGTIRPFFTTTNVLSLFSRSNTKANKGGKIGNNSSFELYQVYRHIKSCFIIPVSHSPSPLQKEFLVPVHNF